MMGVTRLLVLLSFCCALPVAAAADDAPVATVRNLYMAADYEQALATLDSLDIESVSPADRVGLEGYKAACLVALGRSTDAERVMESIVRSDPAVSEPVEASPKVRALFAGVRSRVLPHVVRERYASAKSLYDDKRYAAAQAAFDDVASLLSAASSSGSGDGELGDVGTLAREFSELSRAGAERARAASAPTAPADGIYTAGDAEIVAPVALFQRVELTAAASRVASSRGPIVVSVAMVISETGRVEQAVLSPRIDPVVDGDLLASAKRWRFQPAQRHGTPVKFSKTIRVELK